MTACDRRVSPEPWVAREKSSTPGTTRNPRKIFFFLLGEKEGRGIITVKKASLGFEHANGRMLIAPVIFKD